MFEKKLIIVFRKLLKDIWILMKLDICIVIFVCIISSFFNYLMLLFIEFITDISNIISDNNTVNRNILNSFVFLSVLLVLLCCVKQIGQVFVIKFNYKIGKKIKLRLNSKLCQINYEEFETSAIYEKVSRLEDKLVEGYQATIVSGIKIVEIICYMISYILFLHKVSVFFSIILVVSTVLSGLLVTKTTKSKYKDFKNVTKYNKIRDYILNIAINKSTHEEYQTSRIERIIADKYKKAYDLAERGYLKIHIYTILAEMRTALIFLVIMCGAYLYLSIRVINGSAKISIMLAIMLVFDNLYKKSTELSYYMSNRIESMLVVEEYYQILACQERGKLNYVNDTVDGDIVFKNVSYSYPKENKKVLKNINLKIRQGETIAIIGENGSGKTTFINIILGLLQEFQGDIWIGKNHFTKNNPVEIGIAKALNQDFELYQSTIKENILFDKESLSDDEIMDILDKVGLKKKIDSLEKGIDSTIGQLYDDGIELSRGEEQKLVAARMIANRKTKIWILDESTAFLDPLGEIEFYNLLGKYFNGKTMIFISHRLGFAPKADKIVRFSNGQIEEMGTHDELMRGGGEYAKMFAHQKKWYE